MWTRPAPFTVVLCTFNGARFLDEQLQSLREQDGVAEIVASDDGSTDDTLAILARHAAEDARIRINQNRERLGVTGNFEQAIRLARSPWIALAWLGVGLVVLAWLIATHPDRVRRFGSILGASELPETESAESTVVEAGGARTP